MDQLGFRIACGSRGKRIPFADDSQPVAHKDRYQDPFERFLQIGLNFRFRDGYDTQGLGDTGAVGSDGAMGSLTVLENG